MAWNGFLLDFDGEEIFHCRFRGAADGDRHSLCSFVQSGREQFAQVLGVAWLVVWADWFHCWGFWVVSMGGMLITVAFPLDPTSSRRLDPQFVSEDVENHTPLDAFMWSDGSLERDPESA